MEIEENIPKPPSHKKFAGLLFLSLLFGLLGGLCGAVYVARSPVLQRLLGSTTTQYVIQRGVYKEDSAIINVVKKSSPAVVSIVISKDVSQASNYEANNPFANNPFFAPYFPNNQNRSNNNKPTPNVQQIGAGSGFLVSADGLILTNRHVVSDEQATYAVVTSDGKSYDAKVLARDPINDLAILKIDVTNAPTLSFSDSSQIEIGQQAVAIGNSLGQYQNTVTSGIVSGIGRSIQAGDNAGSEQLEGVIQTDAAINPGNSGGPLLNLAGQVIGINTAIDQGGQSVGFAIPANDITYALNSYKQFGKIQRPMLGVRYMPITKELAAAQKLPRDYGALLVGDNASGPAVIAGSPAAKAGLAENDIILEVNGIRIDEKNSLAAQLKNFKVGSTINLKIYHQGAEKTVSVTLDETK